MIQFSTVDLLDEDKCYVFLRNILHPDGFCCPRCKRPVEKSRVHRRDRAPVLYFRCSCGRIYNAFAGTVWQKTSHRCSMIVRILQGFSQGVSTKHLAEELGIDRVKLLKRRHQLQDLAANALPRVALNDSVIEADEMYQNSGEKRYPAYKSRRPTSKTRQQSQRSRHLEYRSPTSVGHCR